MSISKGLVEQSVKFYNMSTQDQQFVYALEHVNYSTAYLNAARYVENDTVLERITGIDISRLLKKIEDQHRKIMKETSSKTKKKVSQQTSWI
jgi:hypothetical protein